MPAIDLDRVGPGFADPVHDAQRVFRSLLTAMAEPGRIVTLDLPLVPPPGLSLAQCATLLTLADRDTPVWLAPSIDTPDVADFLAFHCASPRVGSPLGARFVVLPDLAQLPALDTLDLGDPAYPDRSSTLIVEVTELAEDGPLELQGPGIPDRRRLYAGGWSTATTRFAAANHAGFPLGVDLVLCCADALAALPRTCRITESTGASSCT